MTDELFDDVGEPPEPGMIRRPPDAGMLYIADIDDIDVILKQPGFVSKVIMTEMQVEEAPQYGMKPKVMIKGYLVLVARGPEPVKKLEHERGRSDMVIGDD